MDVFFFFLPYSVFSLLLTPRVLEEPMGFNGPHSCRYVKKEKKLVLKSTKAVHPKPRQLPFSGSGWLCHTGLLHSIYWPERGAFLCEWSSRNPLIRHNSASVPELSLSAGRPGVELEFGWDDLIRTEHSSNSSGAVTAAVALSQKEVKQDCRGARLSGCFTSAEPHCFQLNHQMMNLTCFWWLGVSFDMDVFHGWCWR